MKKMMDEAMNLEAFRTMLDDYGAHEATWPAVSRKAARLLLERSEAATHELQRAKDLDRSLSALQNHTLTPGLATRISANVDGSDPWAAFFGWLGEKLWRPTAMLLAPLMIGVLVGAALPDAASDSYLTDYPWVDAQEFTFDE